MNRPTRAPAPYRAGSPAGKQDGVHKQRLLWVDLAVSRPEADLPSRLSAEFSVSRSAKTQPLGLQLQRLRCDLVFFDFDYPDQASLRMAATLKQEHPSVPMVMLTVQHSEALAVWAFRSRFADYLVKPVPEEELARCLDLLACMTSERRGQVQRRIAAESIPMPEEAPTPTVASSALLPAIYYVERNFQDKIASEDAARLCGMSPFRFGRAFKDAFGMPFRDYVVRVRLQEASRLLQNPQASVSEVAYTVGFNDMSYFSRMFKRYFGVSPSAMQDSGSPPARSAPPVAELLPPLLLPQSPRLN